MWTSHFLGDDSACSWSELGKECMGKCPQSLLPFRGEGGGGGSGMGGEIIRAEPAGSPGLLY